MDLPNPFVNLHHGQPAVRFLRGISMNFQNQVALITGGSSGIGLATARLLAGRGAHVWLVARDQGRLDAALAQVVAARRSATQRFGVVSADLADPVQAAGAVSQVAEAAGLPDLLINAAGAARPGCFQDLDVAVFHEMMDINFFSAVHTARAVIPGMIARRSGYIVNISSEAAFMGVYGYTAYGAAKYALRGFSDALRAEMKQHRIRVSVVFPPNTDTPGLATENRFKPAVTAALEDSAKLLSPEAVAAEIVKGISQGRYMIIPGFEGKLYYWLAGVAGTLQYPVMDILVARALRQHGPGQLLSGR